MPISLHQSVFAFGLDDGAESTHTLGTTNANLVATADTPFTLRFSVWETGGTDAAKLVQYFQYSHNGGAWTDITTTSSVVKSVAVGAFVNGDDCTRRLGVHGTFEASGDGCTEDGSSGGNQNTIPANGSGETECGIQIVGTDVAQGDSIQFRLRVTGPTTTIVYDVTPTAFIPISKAPAAAALAVAGVQPSAVLSHLRAAVLGAVVLAGLAPTATQSVPNITASPAAASMALSGQTVAIPTLTVDLRENDTVRATRYVSLTSAEATSKFALTAEEAAAIVAWDQLRYTFTANSGQVQVSWAEVEAPAAETALAESPTVGALSLAGLQPAVAQTAPGLTCSPASGALALAGDAPTLPSLTFTLLCGDTEIASQTVPLYAGLSEQSFALDASEVAAITNWGALRFSFVANVQQAQVTWAELETPAAAEAGVFTPAAASLAFAGDIPVLSYSTPITVSPDLGAMAFEGTAISYQRIQLWMGPSATGTLIAERVLEFTDAFATYEFVLSSAEVAEITDWSDLHLVVVADLYAQTISWLEVEVPEAGNATSAGTLAFAGLAPLPFADAVDAVTAGSFAVTGTTPTIQRTYLVTPGAGALSFVGTEPAPVGVADPPRGTLALTGLSPTIATDQPSVARTPTAGTLALSGVAPSALQALSEAPTAGAFAFASDAPTLGLSCLETAGALALSGIAPLVSVSSTAAVVVAPDVAELAFVGLIPTITQAPVGPEALRWGSEALVAAGCAQDSVVSARVTGDTLEFIS